MFPQPDLFEPPPPQMVFAPAERTKLVDQLRALLIEAMATPEVAAAANYRSAFALDRREDIGEAVRTLRERRGPSLLHVKIRRGSPEKLGRPTVKPHEVKDRFSAFLRSRMP